MVYPFVRKNPYNAGISRGDMYTFECFGLAFGEPFGYLDNTCTHLPPFRVGGDDDDVERGWNSDKGGVFIVRTIFANGPAGGASNVMTC